MVAFGFITRRAAVEPRSGEGVVFGEIGELVPVVVDRVDEALVGARKRAFELKIVGRVGEDEIDRSGRQLLHFGDAVADEDDVARGGADCGRAFRLAGASTQNLKLGGETRRSGTQGTHQRKSLDATAGFYEPARRLWLDLSKGLVMGPRLTLCHYRTAPASRRRFAV